MRGPPVSPRSPLTPPRPPPPPPPAGFITPEDGSRDVFVHFTSILSDGFRTLREGDQVEFEINETPKGIKAGAVVLNVAVDAHDDGY